MTIVMAKLAGWVTLSQVELQTQSWYFAFQVIQVFLITTCASAATAVIQQVRDDPGAVLTLLSNNLPKASNFYVNYFILFGLSSAAGTLLNIGGFVGIVLLGRILPGKTPRKVWQKLVNLSAPAWGSEFPKWTNLGVIALTYSGIAPLVLGFATVGFSLIYIAFRYNFLYCYETNIDTQGQAYQRALRQLITGVYLSEGCLIGLFAIATGDHTAAAGPLAIECVLLALTIIAHVCLRSALTHHEARVAYTDPTPTTASLEHGLAQAATPEKAPGAAQGHASSPNLAPKPSKVPSFLRKLIDPERNSTPQLASRLDQFYHQPQEPLPVEIEKRAYFNPAITSPTPILWIVRDEMGISQREVRDTKKEVPGLEITDEQAVFNEKNKVMWQGQHEGKAREAPVWEERIIY